MNHAGRQDGPRSVRLVIHPGLAKAGTTTVQSVLRADPGLWFCGLRSHAPDHPFTQAFERVLHEPLDRWTWRRRVPLESEVERLAAIISDGLRSSPHGVGVLSHEAILGHVGDNVGWRGPYEARAAPQEPGWEIARVRISRLGRVVERIRDQLADVGVALDTATVLTIRRPGPLLASTWAWNYLHYRALGVRSEDDLLGLVMDDRLPRLRFHEVAATLVESGLGPVTAVPIESLERDPGAFWTVLSGILAHRIHPLQNLEPQNNRQRQAGTWIARTVANPRTARISTSASFHRAVGPLPERIRVGVEHAIRPRSSSVVELTVSRATLDHVDAFYAHDTPSVQRLTAFPLHDLGYRPDPTEPGDPVI